MADELALQKHAVMAKRFRSAGMVALTSTAMLLIAGAVVPIGALGEEGSLSARQRVPELTPPSADARSLATKVAGSQLIRPAQVQAAVKGTGAAQKLLERLTLQSVVQMGGESVAYVRVKDGGVQTVRAGGRLLDLQVDEIAPGQVKLSLDGVEVVLSY